jgi:hypothetical protein
MFNDFCILLPRNKLYEGESHILFSYFCYLKVFSKTILLSNILFYSNIKLKCSNIFVCTKMTTKQFEWRFLYSMLNSTDTQTRNEIIVARLNQICEILIPNEKTFACYDARFVFFYISLKLLLCSVKPPRTRRN